MELVSVLDPAPLSNLAYWPIGPFGFSVRPYLYAMLVSNSI